ncbi:type II secretion system major pseudopilin GspG [Orrella sp. JC864]|uniref:type II secretion system major pseudopilin GspG n=1 Tax=Orrella sp. JC864 TaxID=3120298 RepID=UPI0012BB68DF
MPSRLPAPAPTLARQFRGPAPGGARHRQRGFSLIEIMIVVVIMGVLAALVVPNVLDRPDQARAVAARQDIASISQALKLYRLDNGRYPSTEQGLRALVERPANANLPNWRKYLERLPNDPWNNPYQYLSPGVHGEFDVFSLGADGQPGGDGSDADIGSWTL